MRKSPLVTILFHGGEGAGYGGRGGEGKMRGREEGEGKARLEGGETPGVRVRVGDGILSWMYN
jgi:hypothetical protein